VEVKATAREQYYYATLLNTVEGWESVAKLHPPNERETNRYYAHLALGQLGWHYLSAQQYDQAEEIYQQLTQLQSTYEESISNGHAGLVVVYNATNNKPALQSHLTHFISDERRLRDISNSELREQVEQIRQSATTRADS